MLNIKGISKTYKMGMQKVQALQNISLDIEQGDFVSIMGASGSGKSTLLHILGLLDVPDEGEYELEGRNTSTLSDTQLALLRKQTIGFIFQQFNLLPRMNALENVSMPLIYSEHYINLDKSKELLNRVGLETHIFHKPNELSGGQQQRVAIARALINHPKIILADEPTGNLDSKSAKEILSILQELNQLGITIVMVTHEEDIANYSSRIIRMKDGTIISDDRLKPLKKSSKKEETVHITRKKPIFNFEFFNYILQGFKILAANKARTALSILGILIGVAAVVAMLAIGSGARKAIETQLSSLGSNLLSLRSGAWRQSGVVQEVGTTTRLTVDDAKSIIKTIPTIQKISSGVSGRSQVSFLNKNWNTQVLGVSPSYASMRASIPVLGRFFTEAEDKQRKRVAVIGQTIVKELFEGKNPLGEMIKMNKVPFLIIGVLPEKGATSFRDQDDVIVIPVLTAMYRLLGKDYLDYIDIEVKTAEDISRTQDDVLNLMIKRHSVPLSQSQEAFQIRNMADIQETLSASSKTMSMLLAAIAAISLLVGGIGIMNIMLVSVTERTREIGLRKAVGAQRKDIMFQFISESIVISVLGGIGGIIIGVLITLGISLLAGWATFISVQSILLAFFFSTSVGLIFGIYPARRAAFLSPIEALRYE